MASGLVVFAGHGGGGPEMVTDGRTGFLVDPDGPVDTVVTRLEALAADRSAFGDMRQLAREEVVRRFSLDRFAAGKADLYRTLRASSDVPVAVRP
jgi:glycosyltransferase involved in cell wall biosynthesis